MSVTVGNPVERPPITDGFKLAIAWTLAAIGALVVALAPLSSSLVDGHYLPIGPDSFYHARRILDAVANPSSYYQFDTLMHAPEGSLVIWPWAYDYFMSLLVRAELALGLARDPMAALVHLPVLAFPVALLLVIAICRGLRLSVPATFFALICTAFFPLNQSLYGIGNIDHHFAEHLFVLGSLGAALLWLKKPDSRGRAITVGLVLALAPGVHTGEFILQLPLLATLAIAWIRGAPRPATAMWFGGALFLGSLAIALPSLALREGHFEYYTLSWFQVYVAACTAILSVLLCRLPFSAKSIGIFAGVGVVMIAPIVGQIALARDFFTVSVEGMDQISEVQSVFELWLRSRSFGYVASIYTYLIVLVPVTAIVCAWRLWKDRDPARCLLWISCLFGLAMLVTQLRLQYFGSLALYLPWLLLIDDRVRAGFLARIQLKPAFVWAGAAVATAIAYAPGVTAHIFEQQVIAGDPNYVVTSQLYVPFARECERAPGVALANPDDGHYVRFHTKCAVIGNNFLLTRQHAEKVAYARKLLSMPAGELEKAAPFVRYVYVRRDSMFFSTPDGQLDFAPGDYPTLPDLPMVRELLGADPARLPPHFRMVYELRLNGVNGAPYARLFAIEPRE
jgi:hypothetical protein